MDIKGMYQQEAEELAYAIYRVEFYDLTDEHQQLIYNKAMEKVHEGIRMRVHRLELLMLLWGIAIAGTIAGFMLGRFL